MALMPPPINDVESTFAFKEWLNKLYGYVQSAAGTIPWVTVDKTGSNLTDIQTRLHNQLQSIQGGTSGEYYHLTSDEYSDLKGETGGKYRGGVDTTDDIIIDSTTSGLVLLDTDGHYWRVTISTAGALVTTDLGTTKP